MQNLLNTINMQKTISYVDIHHHYNPLDGTLLNDRIRSKTLGGEFARHDIKQTLEMMEACGIKRSILSYPKSLLSLSENERASVCTRINEGYAELIAQYPKLGAFAQIPISLNSSLALKEIEYALDVLHLDGILLPASVFGLYPSSGLYLDIYKEMERRKGCIFFHPFVSEDKAGYSSEEYYRLAHDITRATFELALNRFPSRYPAIRFIMSYGGGNLSYLLKTDGENSQMPSAYDERRLPLQKLAHFFEGLYYDTCLLDRTESAQDLYVSPVRKRILYGSNFPYSTIETVRLELDELAKGTCDGSEYMNDICLENSSFLL